MTPTATHEGSRSIEEFRVPARPRFWLNWTLASVVAGTLGLAIMAETPPYLAGNGLSGEGTNTSGYAVGWAVALGGALAGATLGGVQRSVLRRHLAQLAGWTIASAAGLTLGLTIVWALAGGGHGDAYAHHALPHTVDGAGPLGGALLGAAFGAAQWLVLRRRVARAGWWVPANAAGFAASWALAAATPVDGVPAHFVGGAIFGVVLGLVTGGVLVRLLPRVPSSASAPGPAVTT